MNLHNDLQLFKRIIELIGEDTNIAPSIIEKDYYVTLILKELFDSDNNYVFKGGTSLYKCFHIINRFSEDVDITYNNFHLLTQGKRKSIKYGLKDICEKNTLKIVNFDNTRSRRNYNNYMVDYTHLFIDNNLNEQVLVEITFIEECYPLVEVDINSIIGEWLINHNYDKYINKFNLKPFKVITQSLERTFIDKIFALCDYYISGKINKHSRHLYDLYKLKNNINFDKSFFDLFYNVKNDRFKNQRNYSAKENVIISELLKEIINNKTFKEDYDIYTYPVLFEDVKYDILIDNLKNIINIFTENNL